MAEDRITLGDQIRVFREATGMTMTAAARKAGMSSGHWSNIEGNRSRAPSIFVIAKMAKVIDARLDDLMHDVALPAAYDGGWTARRASQEDTRIVVEEFCRLRKEFRQRDLAEAFGRSASSYHLTRMRHEGKIAPLDDTLPPTSPNWRYRWVGARNPAQP